jgi:hypothetical protein
MQLRGRKLKFTAVAALVVLSLTGFSTGRGHRSGGDGGGGGCSSSSQSHDSSSSTSGGGTYRDYDHDDDDDSYGDSGSSDVTTPLQDATVKLIDCATPTDSYATVEVTNPNAEGAYFTVTVDFLDAGSDRVEVGTADEFVAANETATVQVDLSSPGVATRVERCVADRDAPAN